jgi:hypothetical protein
MLGVYDRFVRKRQARCDERYVLEDHVEYPWQRINRPSMLARARPGDA